MFELQRLEAMDERQRTAHIEALTLRRLLDLLDECVKSRILREIDGKKKDTMRYPNTYETLMKVEIKRRKNE